MIWTPDPARTRVIFVGLLCDRTGHFSFRGSPKSFQPFRILPVFSTVNLHLHLHPPHPAQAIDGLDPFNGPTSAARVTAWPAGQVANDRHENERDHEQGHEQRNGAETGLLLTLHAEI